MSLRAKLNEAQTALAPYVLLAGLTTDIQKHLGEQDTLSSLASEIEKAREDLASERDMLASTENDLTEALQKVQALEIEAAGILGKAESRAEEMVIEARAKIDTMKVDATTQARRKQLQAEQDLEAMQAAIAAAKNDLEALEKDRTAVKRDLVNQLEQIAKNDQRIAAFNASVNGI